MIGIQGQDSPKFNIFDLMLKKTEPVSIGGVTPKLDFNALQNSVQKPTIQKPIVQPTQNTPASKQPVFTSQPQQNIFTPQPTQPKVQGRGPTNLFINEKQALESMLNDGIDEQTAIQAIKEKRQEKLGKITQNESQALIAMANDGVDINEAIQAIKEKRNEDLPLWKKALKVPFDASVGALGMVSEQVGNVGGFLGDEGIQQQGQEVRQIGERITGDSFGAKAGKFITGAGEILATGPVKVAPTLAGRIGQGALVGGLTGAGTPILEKGSETTAGDIIQGGLIGGTVGAVATPVFEKVVAPVVGKVASKTLKYGQAGYQGGLQGLGKSIARDVKSGIIQPFQKGSQNVASKFTLGGLINPQKLDYVKKNLQVDEGVATPQDVGSWLLARIKPGNKQEIADQLITYSNKTKGAVDDSLAKIPTRYNNDTARKALEQLEADLSKIPGMESEVQNIRKLLNQSDYSLSDMQIVKRKLDEYYNIYKQSGEVGANLKAQGLNKIRAEIRKFIEDEAGKFGVNIRKLNNDTAIARGLAEGILKKDNADAVREFLTAFAPSGVGSVIGAGQSIAQGNDPLTVIRDALIGGITAKVLTSTRVRTSIANQINKLGPKQMSQLELFIKSGGKDAVGKKVAEDLIRRGRLLPAPGQTSIKPINLPAKGQLQKTEKAFMKQVGKQPGTSLKNTKYANNNTSSVSSNNNSVLLKPQTQATQTLQKLTPKNLDETAQSLAKQLKTDKVQEIKQVIKEFIKKEGKRRKEKIGELLDKIATKIGAKLNFIEDRGTGISGKIEAPKELIDEAKKYKSAEEFYDKFTAKSIMDLSDRAKHKYGRLLEDGVDEDTMRYMDAKYTADIYGSRGNNEYKWQKEAMVPDVKTKEDIVTIYRGTKKSQKEMEPGDFVSFNKEYASGHNVDGGHVISIKVPAKDVVWQGADLHEWIYSPEKLRGGEKYNGGLKKIWEQATNKFQKGTWISGKIEAPKELIDEAKKYKSAEEFILNKQKSLADNLSYYDDDISDIQSLRHDIHTLNESSLYNSESGNFKYLDDYTEEIADKIDGLDITGNERDYSDRIKGMLNQERKRDDDLYNLDDDFNELRNSDKIEDRKKAEEMLEEYEIEALSEINEEKEAINKVIEEYLQELDKMFDELDLQNAKDLDGYHIMDDLYSRSKGDGTFAPSGYARARSILGEGYNNTAKSKRFESGVPELRKIWEQANK